MPQQAVVATLYQAAGPLLTHLYKQELAVRRELRDVVALVTCRAKFLPLVALVSPASALPTS
jgi:hypothetical protein